MKYKFIPKTLPSEITPQEVYKKRRQIIQSMLALPLATSLPAWANMPPLPSIAHAEYNEGRYDEITPKEKAQQYNNFYELGTAKEDPASNYDLYEPTPWTVMVDGEVHKPQRFDIDQLYTVAPMEERVYRLRCVEAWSMVIPWIGYSLSHLLKKVEPTANAKYVEFVTFNPDDLYPEKGFKAIDWPYVEGLRMDEAMHPLTLLTFGMYGEYLPTQNGAPTRLMVPWKYGFKSGKALVRIRLTATQPKTAWNVLQPGEYGFYANVNPHVDHPRWSQARERVINNKFFTPRRDTEMFNGFGDEVAGLYAGMDLTVNY